MFPFHQRRKKRPIKILLFKYHNYSLLSQHYFPCPLCKSSERISAPKTGWWGGGHLNLLPSKAPKVCLPLPFFPSRSLFVPAQQSYWSERWRPRRGKQVPGCQSRTRPEQERTGLNRCEQILAGPPARRRRRLRAPLYIRHTSPALAPAQPNLLHGGGATMPRRFRFTRPSWWPVRSGSGHPDTFTVAVRETRAVDDWGRGEKPRETRWGWRGREYSPRFPPSFRCYCHFFFPSWPAFPISPLKSN